MTSLVMCNAPLSCVCCVLVVWGNPELACGGDLALFLVNTNITFPCPEWVFVQQFVYFLGIGYVPAGGGGSAPL